MLNVRAASEFISSLMRTDSPQDHTDWVRPISEWRDSLPPGLQVHAVRRWSASNVCLLVLMAASYRMECMLYRLLRNRSRGKDDSSFDDLSLRLYGAVFELETIIGRVMAHDLTQYTTLLL